MERMWPGRLRWRLAGAWQWPAFAALTLVDTLLLHTLPLSGQNMDYVPAFLIAGFANLLAVALLAPVVAKLVRRRRRDLPWVVAVDTAATSLVVAVTVGFLVAGLAHRGDLRREEAISARAVELARDFASHSAPDSIRDNVSLSDTIRVDPGRLYRTCVPTADLDRPWCVVVHMDIDPPRVVRSGREPNVRWQAAGSAG